MKKLTLMAAGISAILLSGCSSTTDFDDLLDCEKKEGIPYAEQYVHQMQLSYKDDTVWTVNMISELNRPAKFSNKTIQKYVSSVSNIKDDVTFSSIDYGVDAEIGVVGTKSGITGTARVVNKELIAMEEFENGVQSPSTRNQEIATNFNNTDIEMDMSTAKDESLLLRIRTCPYKAD